MDTFEQAADRLIEMGYLKYLTSGKTASARKEMIDTLRRGYLDTEWDKKCVAKDRRGYSADSEELAEGHMGETLLQMKPVLEKEGVRLESVEDDIDDYYNLIINGQPHEIYDQQILASGSIWAVSTKRFLEIVDQLLKKAKSKERLYGIYGGNDGRVLLLTKEMHNLLRSPDLGLDRRWLPYRSTAIQDDGTIAQ